MRNSLKDFSTLYQMKIIKNGILLLIKCQMIIVLKDISLLSQNIIAKREMTVVTFLKRGGECFQY